MDFVASSSPGPRCIAVFLAADVTRIRRGPRQWIGGLSTSDFPAEKAEIDGRARAHIGGRYTRRAEPAEVVVLKTGDVPWSFATGSAATAARFPQAQARAQETQQVPELFPELRVAVAVHERVERAARERAPIGSLAQVYHVLVWRQRVLERHHGNEDEVGRPTGDEDGDEHKDREGDLTVRHGRVAVGQARSRRYATETARVATRRADRVDVSESHNDYGHQVSDQDHAAAEDDLLQARGEFHSALSRAWWNNADQLNYRILTTSLILLPLKDWENVLFELGDVDPATS